MKIRISICYLAILFFSTLQLWATNTNPVVSNVLFSIFGTTVTVTYDVSDSEEATVTIIMEVSEDEGATWTYGYGATSGDIGTDISTGTGKTITWTYSGGGASNFKIKIVADDLVGDQIYYSGQIYNTVAIGTQTWLKENLNVGTKINSNGAGDIQTNNSIIEKYCLDNLESNCTSYGGLYQWNEAMQYVTTDGAQGICPAGWHIPTYAEELTLKTEVGGSNALKVFGSGSGSGIGTNSSGFSALPSGFRSYIDGIFNYGTTYSLYWSSTEYNLNTDDGNYIYHVYYDNNIYTINNNKNYAMSIRCLKN